MAEDIDVLVVGESLIDEIRAVNGDVGRHPGGSPANVAIGLARLGRSVALRTSYGDDSGGSLIDSAIRSAGVHPIVDPPRGGRTSTARAEVLPDGSARYEFDLQWDLRSSVEIPHSRVLHVGSLGALLAPGRNVVRQMCDDHDGLVTLDLNIRPAIADEEAGSREALETLVDIADVVKASDEDIAWMYPDVHPFEVARRWLENGASVACVTLGERGIYAATARGHAQHPARAPRIVDTVGAGDTVMAVLVNDLIPYDLEDIGRGLDDEALDRIVNRAVTAASLTLGRSGADLPTARELADASA